MLKMKKYWFWMFTCVLVTVINSQDQVIHKLVNLDQHCFRCLCRAATNCNMTFGCVQGYCGPYKISRIYWIDAGRVTLPDDDVERAGAYEDCALSFHCAQRIVLKYFLKYGRDCNDDGVTDCNDYSMINFNGGHGCRGDLNRSEPGRAWLKRYHACNPYPAGL
uniref:lysozyme n=1 Tax=Harmonia axyridis TaxID=115357 RepID=A0A0S1TPE9_HARAX|nr:i-type lysozyme 1 [Harmonia axyridis]